MDVNQLSLLLDKFSQCNLSNLSDLSYLSNTFCVDENITIRTEENQEDPDDNRVNVCWILSLKTEHSSVNFNIFRFLLSYDMLKRLYAIKDGDSRVLLTNKTYFIANNTLNNGLYHEVSCNGDQIEIACITSSGMDVTMIMRVNSFRKMIEYMMNTIIDMYVNNPEASIAYLYEYDNSQRLIKEVNMVQAVLN